MAKRLEQIGVCLGQGAAGRHDINFIQIQGTVGGVIDPIAEGCQIVLPIAQLLGYQILIPVEFPQLIGNLAQNGQICPGSPGKGLQLHGQLLQHICLFQHFRHHIGIAAMEIVIPKGVRRRAHDHDQPGINGVQLIQALGSPGE